MTGLETGIHGRRGRFILAVLAVIVGVGLASGAVFVRSSVHTSVHDWVNAMLGSDVYVQPKGSNLADVLMKPGSQQQFVPSATPGTVSSVSQVQAVYPVYIGQVTLLKSDNTVISSGWAPSLGISPDTSHVGAGDLLAGGAWPNNVTQVVLEQGTAQRAHLAVGDQINVVAAGSVLKATVTGIVDYHTSLGGANLVVLNDIAARALFSSSGMLSYVGVQAKDGVTAQQLADAVSSNLGTDTNAQVVLGSEVRQQVIDRVDGSLDLLTGLLLLLGVVGAIIGGFLLANTFASSQRAQSSQIATLKALGASTDQVMRPVLRQALTAGVIGSVIGLVVGFLLNQVVLAVLSAKGVVLATGWPWLGGLLCLVGGVVLSAAAAWIGAYRASTAAPAGAKPSRLAAIRVIVGVVLLVGGIVLVVLGINQHSWGNTITSMVVIAVGVVLLAPALMTVLAPVFTAVLRPASAVGARLAAGSIRLNPRRAANIAGVFIITMAVATTALMLVSSAEGAQQSGLGKEISADYVLTPSQPNGIIPDSIVAQISQISNAKVAAFGSAPIQAEQDGQGSPQPATVWFGPATAFADAVTTPIIEGSAADFGSGVAVNQAYATAHDIKLGDTINFTVAQNSPYQMQASLPVKLIIKSALFPDMVVPLSWLTGQIPAQTRAQFVPSTLVFIGTSDPGAAASLQSDVGQIVNQYQSFTLQTREAFTKAASPAEKGATVGAYAVMVVCVIVAILAIIGMLGQGVWVREHEFALVKALGADDEQVRRSVVFESVVICFTGCLVGVIIGIVFGLVGGVFITGGTTVPWLWVVVFLVLSVLIGIVGSLGVARRAAKVPVTA